MLQELGDLGLLCLKILVKKLSVVVAVLVIIVFSSSAQAAVFGEVCVADSDCTGANQECVKYLECTTGTCGCISGYGHSSNNGCGHILRSYGETCGSDSYCSGANQECGSTSGTCECSMWYTYSTLAAACVTVTYKVLTESCGGWWNEECLVTDSEGGECTSTYSACGCKAGYVMDLTESYIACRAPRYGEICEWSPSCTVVLDSSTISDDQTSIPPTCQDNICTCAPSHNHMTALGHDLCIAPQENELKSNGEECIHFNECESSLCVKCVNTTTGVCMNSTSGTGRGVESSVLAILAGFIFLYTFLKASTVT